MALRNAQDVTLQPAGVSDALDGTNAPPGAMARLANLIPARNTDKVFVPRPAAVQKVDLTGISATGLVTVILVLGTRVYGMIESTTYAGKDEPFCYDLATNSFVTIDGVSSGLLPSTVASTGDWVPATMVAVTNTLILVTHPGFPGSSGPFFGWLDTSDYSSTVMKGNLTIGSAVIQSVYTVQGVSAPILEGVRPGQLITGTGIPAGTYIKSATNGTFSLNTTGDTHSNTTLDNLASTTGVAAGMIVTGPGILANTWVQSVDSSTQVTLSQAAIATAAGVAINFSGGGTITMSANATATNNLVALTVTGGTASAPLWGAGNTNTNPLSDVPKCTCGFNGRAYFGVGPFLVYSDPLNPLQVSLASQALVLGDSNSITALFGTPLASQLTGGIVQSLTAFKGAGPMFQITGDVATGDLKQNYIQGSVGTLAPRTIAGTPYGTAFMAADGFRILQLNGTVSPPIGSDGSGVNTPFLNAVFPSRMCAAYDEGIYRITVTNGDATGDPTVEYWLDMDSQRWSGPHSFPATAIYQLESESSFLLVPLGIPASIWQSDVLPVVGSTYVENGTVLQCTYRTVLLPDNAQGAFNRVVQANLAAALSSTELFLVSVVDDTGMTLGTYSFGGFGSPGSVWGAFLWGAGTWGGDNASLRQYTLRFAEPLFFRQAYVDIAFKAADDVAIGNLYVKLQPLRFNQAANF